MASDILIVDDEADIRELISGILEDEGHGTRLAKDSDETLAAVEERRPSLVILDIWLQGSKLDGLELLDRIKRAHPDLPVVIISGHGNIETAVAAIKRGAYDYVEKPFKADRLVLIAERAIETSKLRKEVKTLKERAGDGWRLVGQSSPVNHLRQMIERIAPTNSRIMISGPSGSGKELVARLIHEHSQRTAGPFIVLNAAAITPDWRIAPPRSFRWRRTRATISVPPVTIDPTGAASPLLRQNCTVSACRAISAGAMPSAAAALKIRAPSICTGTPVRSRSAVRPCSHAIGSTRPERRLCVFSIAITPVRGYPGRSCRIERSIRSRSIVPSISVGSTNWVIPPSAAGLPLSNQ